MLIDSENSCRRHPARRPKAKEAGVRFSDAEVELVLLGEPLDIF